jgi:hypothetical protein
MVLLASMKKISKIKESSKNLIGMNPMIPEGSIDPGKSSGWRIKMQGGANESFAYGVGESIMKPNKLEESNAFVYLKKDPKNRVRLFDKEKRQMEMLNHQAEEVLEKTGVEMRQLEEAQKIMIQGHQGATQESKHHNNGGYSIVTIPKSAFVKMELE